MELKLLKLFPYFVASIIYIDLSIHTLYSQSTHSSSVNLSPNKNEVCQPCKTKKHLHYFTQKGLGIYDNGDYKHIVKKNENLLSISMDYLAFTDYYVDKQLVKSIKALNHIEGKNVQVGKMLIIPIVRNQPSSSFSVSLSHNAYKGIYMNAYTASQKSGINLIKKFKAAGGNTIIVDVKDVTGNVFFPTKVKLANQVRAHNAKYLKDFNKFINIVHSLKMRVVARFTCFADYKLNKRAPAYALKTVNEKDVVSNDKIYWVDPTHPKVRGYLIALIKNLLDEYGVDEVQLDYVRFPDYPFALATHDYGVSREDAITSFLEEVHYITKLYEIPISVSVYGISAWENERDIRVLGQRLPRMALHCEGIHSMLYSSHFSEGFAGFNKPADHPDKLVKMALDKLKGRLPENYNLKLTPWLQAFKMAVTNFDEKYILKNIRGAASVKDGFYFWNASNNYDILLSAMEMIKKDASLAKNSL